MSNKSILYTYGLIAVILLVINCISANISDNEVNDVPKIYMRGIKVYQRDPFCAMQGGTCVHSNDCLAPSTVRGLCPTNAKRGVECCYEIKLITTPTSVGTNYNKQLHLSTQVPVGPAPCAQHLGECMERCHRTLIRPGTDCQNGHMCCVLV